MSTVLLYLLIGIPALWLGILLAIYYFQESMIFAPEKLPFNHIYQFQVQGEERNFVLDRGVVINALHFKTENPKGLIFYIHGNAGSLQMWGLRAPDYLKYGYDVLMFDYRSFGKSTGKIRGERMLHKDTKRLLEEMLKEYPIDQIVIFGVSLGTGIASKLAADVQPRLLILETPYFHFYDVAKYHYPYLPNSVLLKYNFTTHKFIRKVKCPVHLIHGTNDVTVPYENSVKLEALSPNIHLFTIENGLHSNLNTYPEYHEEMARILGATGGK